MWWEAKWLDCIEGGLAAYDITHTCQSKFGQMTRDEQKNMSWIAYTDGGAAPSNPGPAAWGAVIITPDKTISHHKGFIGHGTNQIAELTAAIEGLLLIPAGAKVELVSDSQYVLKGLTEWRTGKSVV